MPLKKSVSKLVQSEKHCKSNVTAKISKGSTGTSAAMKMTVSNSAPTMTGRLHHRKVLRLAGKRPGAHHHNHHHHAQRTTSLAITRAPSLDHAACDNSDDSGLGVHLRFDHHMEPRPLHYSDRNVWVDDVPVKRRKIELKVENEETNDGYCFPETLKNCKENNTIIRTVPCTPIHNLGRTANQNVNSSKNINRCLPLVNRRQPVSGPITLTTQFGAISKNGKVQLQIMCQPEQQHRARYQTEGSRGAVKDRTGNGFPIVKLIGYDKPTTLQIFIGTDLGRVAPHMFYQACRVSGKNSTPCIEKKIDGTIVIEIELEPSKDMVATCDCVGILKERNVDVEHRFPEQLSPRSKKKSTKCRMVFRTTITNIDGTTETLQVCSQPIVCTQPPGVPEICKKSLNSCSVNGGLELFILGKNFLKDTKVVFQHRTAYDSSDRSDLIWEEIVSPDKEYLQQTHLVCIVPRYINTDIQEPISVRLFVVSSGKNSEAHNFVYTPSVVEQSVAPVPIVPSVVVSVSPATVTSAPVTVTGSAVGLEANPSAAPFLSKMLWQTGTPKQEMDLGMMPPPSTMVPLAQRRPSTNVNVEVNSPPMRSLKTELMDENSQGSIIMDTMINENSLDMQHRFRTINENSIDIHHDEANMTIINDNNINNLMPQNIYIKTQIEALNDNSSSMNSAFHCEASNHSIHNDETVDNSLHTEPQFFSQTNRLSPHTVHAENSTLTTTDLKGIDLRMKNTLGTINDLANTQSPSLATLHRFVVTESSNMPLPAQTGQSVENYLTTLENSTNKTIVSDTVASTTLKSENSLLEGTSILSSQLSVTSSANTINDSQLLPTETPSGTNKLFCNEQNMNNTLLTTSANHEILPSLTESQIKNNNTFEQHSIINDLLDTRQTEVLKQDNLIMSQQNLQVALNANILQNATISPKLDDLVNCQIKTSQKLSPVLPSSSQDIIRRSPLIGTQNSDILLNPVPSNAILTSQVLSSAIAGNELIIHSPPNEIPVTTQISPNTLPSNVILNSQVSLNSQVPLNPQVSPVICATTHDTLLQVNPICSQGVLSNSEILTTAPETIVLNAAVDYLETQKKINEINRIDNLLQTVKQPKTENPSLLQSLLEVQSNPTEQEMMSSNPAHLLQNQVSGLLNMNQTQFVGSTNSQDILTHVNLNLQITKQENTDKSKLNLVKQITEQTAPSSHTSQPTVEMKKNEEGMMQALSNMSENDLISYINPSCFDQV